MIDIYHPDAYHGSLAMKKYFEGWYFKLVSKNRDSVNAIIPGVSFDKDGRSYCFIQILNGLDAAREICQKFKSSKVLMLTQYDDQENILASHKVGAVGFIPKAAASVHLLTGIRSVARGDQSWIESLSNRPDN